MRRRVAVEEKIKLLQILFLAEKFLLTALIRESEKESVIIEKFATS